MRQLARTLLILGSFGACERAQPVVDSQARPAVGNIGQTGKPQRPAAIAQPLVDATGAPAVGNIGQTGRPPAHRVKRVKRAAARPMTVTRPLVNREERPMVGNVLSKPMPSAIQLEIQAGGAAQAAAESPLLDRRQRPAHANMGRRARLEPVENHEALQAEADAE